MADKRHGPSDSGGASLFRSMFLRSLLFEERYPAVLTELMSEDTRHPLLELEMITVQAKHYYLQKFVHAADSAIFGSARNRPNQNISIFISFSVEALHYHYTWYNTVQKRS
jgi:hypothetical protein